MGNCLVRKLKESVQNNSLHYLNALEINVHAVDSQQINNKLGIWVSTNAQNPTIKSIGGSFSVNGVSYTEYPMTTGENPQYRAVIDVENKDYKIIVENAKYHVLFVDNLAGGSPMTGYVSPFGFDLGQFDYNSELSGIDFASIRFNDYIYGKFKPINPDNLTTLILLSNNMELDLADLAGSTHIKNIQLRSNKEMGDIVNLASNINCSFINVSTCPNVTGSIESFAAAQKLAGKQAGTTTKVYVYGTQVTCEEEDTVGSMCWLITYDNTETGYTITSVALY